MKKITKPNPLKVFNDNKAAAYKKAGGAMKSFKKSLVKAQSGKETPFQEYMRTPGAVPSDTVMVSAGGIEKAPLYYARPNNARNPSAKDPKNQSMLNKAFEATYGLDWRDTIGFPADGETYEQYRRRMGPLKKGGAVKTYAKGGSVKRKKK